MRNWSAGWRTARRKPGGAGNGFPSGGMSWTSSNPVDDWHNLSVWKAGEKPRIVAVYQRNEVGDIVNLEVLA